MLALCAGNGAELHEQSGALAAVWCEYVIRLAASHGVAARKDGRRLLLSLFLLVFGASACSTGPRDIQFGKEECANCSMTVTDQRFAAELVTNTSKTYVFDAIECLAAFMNQQTVPEADIASIWVMRHDAPGIFTDGMKAWYLHSPAIQSPMGMNLAGFEKEAEFNTARSKHGGELLRWTGLRLLLAKEWGDETGH